MPNYGLGETFDLGRAYAQSEAVKGSQLDSEYRGLQIQAARKQLNTPEKKSYEDTINESLLLAAAFDSIGSDPTDDNVRRNGSMLEAAGVKPQDFDKILAMPLDQRSREAPAHAAQLHEFVKNAVAPEKGAKPETGIGNVDPSKYTSQSLAEYSKTVDVKTGLGDFSKLVPLPNMGSSDRSPYHTPVYTDKGVFDFNNRDGTLRPAPGGPDILRTVDDPKVRADIAGAEQAAKLAAERQQVINTRLQNMGEGDQILDSASDLVRAATGSYAGALTDKFMNVFGIALSGDEAISGLKVISARLVANVPRMEGPQSDKDVQMYKDAAGDLGSPTVPAGKKFAAIRIIRALNGKYKELQGASSSGPQSFASEADAQAAFAAGKLKNGDRVIVNGQSGTWQQ